MYTYITRSNLFSIKENSGHQKRYLKKKETKTKKGIYTTTMFRFESKKNL
jgi:hypothetical protein